MPAKASLLLATQQAGHRCTPDSLHCKVTGAGFTLSDWHAVSHLTRLKEGQRTAELEVSQALGC